MQYFTKRIEVDRRFYGFYFNKIYTAEGIRYHISVVDKDRKAYSFKMKEEQGRWVLVNKGNCPEWIAQIEDQLSAIIKDNQTD